MNNKYLLAIFFAILAIVAVHAQEDEEDSDVLVLTQDNFDETLANSEIIMVEFYAPWCGHCKKLIPEYDAAATELKGEIPIAKVDATVHTELGTKYGVRGYPTIKVFRKGSDTPKDYNGQRTSEAIVSYLRKQMLPAVTPLKTEEEVTAFQEKDKVVVVGFFASEDDSHKAFLSVVDKLRDDFTFGAVVGASLAEKFGTSEPGIVLFKNFDERKAVYAGKFDASEITSFVVGESVPLLDEIGPENYQKYMDTKLPLGFFFIDPKADNADLKEKVSAIAKAHKGKVNFCWIDNSKYNSQAGRLGLSGKTVPAFAFDHPVKGTHYAFSEEGEFSTEALSAWVTKFVAGEIEPTVKSEEIPENNDGPVTVLVGKNFDDVVINSKKDVFVEFYAPWCGHCKQLAPIWDQLGEAFAKNDDVVIAKIDATANDVDPKFGIRGFPTLKFFKGDSKQSPVSYDGERDLESLTAFVNKNAVNQPKDLKEDL